MTTGKAYAFFDCKASKEAIEKELPAIRRFARTPSRLELSLMEGVDGIKGDEKLHTIVEQARQASIRYALEATLPRATHEATADEVAAIINQMYHTDLYEDGAQFNGEIVYQNEEGNYIFRE